MKRTSSILVGVGVLFVVVVLLAVANALSQKDVNQSVALPILAVTAVITLLGVLAMVSIAFAAIGLGDKTQALGLPDGSIRSVIALSLVVLFAIFCVYLYSSLSSDHVEAVAGLSPDAAQAFEHGLQPGALISDVPTGAAPAPITHTLYFHSGPSQASNDFAKQILTLVGTLVTAIASFYFGSNAVASAVAQVSPPAAVTPKPVSFTPTAGSNNAPVTLTITGTGLSAVDGVFLRSAAGSTPATKPNAASTDSNLTVTLTLPAAAGAYQVICHAAGKDVQAPGVFTVQ